MNPRVHCLVNLFTHNAPTSAVCDHIDEKMSDADLVDLFNLGTSLQALSQEFLDQRRMQSEHGIDCGQRRESVIRLVTVDGKKQA